MIQEFWENIKKAAEGGNEHRQDFLIGGGVVVLVLISFGLGRLSVLQNIPPEAISIETKSETSDTSEDAPSIYQIVASQQGSKYHLLNCPGAQQIKEDNKIFFSSEVEAERAGYEPAGNCPGLDKK
ncbi:MAG: hypothetical protein A2806_00775 [Candidatus Terrybacteria bacterium RIFCSPHIGHO2_01_FULL_48_17]|uniref:Ada DNA repair metal-binding domain-containing protein n=1 Tax=Candidatus Terrybacteria bacterium RIFCSPHIGHO2_01_FULL_48_17 TaxID=1802362 RepID=A0A1G2PIL7_9BACT|nr:MAG: hypothetical protein A2806_00775 [Candidatus Terrybacteria bacterium RIFCSPHIGHO2_01_FULL_48_17]